MAYTLENRCNVTEKMLDTNRVRALFANASCLPASTPLSQVASTLTPFGGHADNTDQTSEAFGNLGGLLNGVPW